MTPDVPKDTGVVLLSGGIDSAVVLAMAARDHQVVYPLHIDYGQQTADVERGMAAGQCEHLAGEYRKTRIRRTPIVDYSPVFSNFAEGVAEEDTVFGHRVEEDGRSSGYVPMRNLHFIATAAGIADYLGAGHLYIGAHADDDPDEYPDCSNNFIRAAQRAVNESLPGSQTIEVRAPLIHSDKPEIIQTGHELGVDFAYTYSCYEEVDDPDDPVQCGECPACIERKNAFDDAGIEDPYEYSV